MSPVVISRVLMQLDGSVHIALKNAETIACTADNLLELLADVYSFNETFYTKYSSTTHSVVPEPTTLSAIPGITLIEIYDDTTIKVCFPAFIRMLKDTIGSISSEPLNMANYVEQNHFTDQTDAFLQVAQEIALRASYGMTLQREVPMESQQKMQMTLELINSFFHSLPSTKERPLETKKKAAEALAGPAPDQIVSVEQRRMVVPQVYASQHGVSRATVMNWIHNKKMKSATKNENGRWLVDADEPIPEDRRAGRTVKRKENGEKHIHAKGTSYMDVQEYIKKRKLFTAAVRPFIRTLEEAKYYTKHYYHEICWDGQPGLIVDIVPEYFSEIHGKTNRELILEGKSPVVAGEDDNFFLVWDIHHVGQRIDSPFAMIPSNIHNGAKTSKIFHQGKANDDDLHTKEFEWQKQLFWRNYLEEYDKAGSFSKIPFLNSRDLKDRR